MNVQELIEVLQKVEDKTAVICFSYDSGCGYGPANIVDLIKNEDGTTDICFLRELEDVGNLYCRSNTEEEERKEVEEYVNERYANCEEDFRRSKIEYSMKDFRDRKEQASRTTVLFYEDL